MGWLDHIPEVKKEELPARLPDDSLLRKGWFIIWLILLFVTVVLMCFLLPWPYVVLTVASGLIVLLMYLVSKNKPTVSNEELEQMIIDFEEINEGIDFQEIQPMDTTLDYRLAFIEQLYRLKLSGAITEGEYNMKKWDILSKKV